MSMTTTAPTRMFARNASARALGRGARKRYEWMKRCVIHRDRGLHATLDGCARTLTMDSRTWDTARRTWNATVTDECVFFRFRFVQTQRFGGATGCSISRGDGARRG